MYRGVPTGTLTLDGSGQDIAARLVVPVRTVEGDLYRAFGKLGVAERSELAHPLGRNWT